MDTTLIINLSIATVIVLGILVLYYAQRRPKTVGKPGSKEGGKQKEPNYEAFFILGISFLPLGIIFAAAIGNPGFLGLTALGIIYMAIGLKNRGRGKPDIPSVHMNKQIAYNSFLEHGLEKGSLAKGKNRHNNKNKPSSMKPAKQPAARGPRKKRPGKGK